MEKGQIRDTDMNNHRLEVDVEKLFKKAIMGVYTSALGACGTAVGLAEMQVGSGHFFKNYESQTRLYLGSALFAVSLICTVKSVYNTYKFAKVADKNLIF